jgi:hypothetical protein
MNLPWRVDPAARRPPGAAVSKRAPMPITGLSLARRATNSASEGKSHTSAAHIAREKFGHLGAVEGISPRNSAVDGRHPSETPSTHNQGELFCEQQQSMIRDARL